MNNLEAILEMWKKDSEIDEMNLDESSRATAKLHSKYLELYTVNKLKLKKLDLELKLYSTLKLVSFWLFIRINLLDKIIFNLRA